jgi:hypothetical protein
VLASHVAKRRAVAHARVRRPLQGSVAPQVVSPTCRSSRHAVAPWELRGARSLRDRGPRGMSRSRVTGRGSSSDRAASSCGVNRYSCSLRYCQGWELPLPPRNPRGRACDTKHSLPATACRHLPESLRLRGALPEDAHGFGRVKQLPLANEQDHCPNTTSTLMRLSHAAPGYLNPGTREGLAPITPEGVIACTPQTSQG